MAIKFSTKDQGKPAPAVKETEAEIATRARVKAAAKTAGAAPATPAAPAKPAIDLFDDEAESGGKTPARGKKGR